MLASQIVTNTWQCDNCGTQAVQQSNPFFHFSLSGGLPPFNTSAELDICQTCVALITLQPIVDYVTVTNQD